MSGTVRDIHRLPRRYLPIVFTRIITWALSPVIPLLSALVFLYPGIVLQNGLYSIVSVGLFGIVFVYTIAGMSQCRTRPEAWLLHLVMTPLTVVLHAVGALWGFLRPVSDFKVTRKTAEYVDVGTLSEEDPRFNKSDVDPDDDTEVAAEPYLPEK